MKKIYSVLVFIILILVSEVLYIYFKPQTNISAIQSHFEFLSLGSDNKSLILKYIIPEEKKGQVVTSKITCPLADTYIFYTRDQAGFTISDKWTEIDATEPEFRLQKINDLLNEIETKNLVKKEIAVEPIYDTIKKGEILRGICKDKECKIIYKQCELYKSI